MVEKRQNTGLKIRIPGQGKTTQAQQHQQLRLGGGKMSLMWNMMPSFQGIVDTVTGLGSAIPRTLPSQLRLPRGRNTQELKMQNDIQYMDHIDNLMHKTQTRQNWNLFVGDQRYKTDFFLRFTMPTTERVYATHVIAGSLYSIRLWLCLQILLLWFASGIFQQAQNANYELYYLQQLQGADQSVFRDYPESLSAGIEMACHHYPSSDTAESDEIFLSYPDDFQEFILSQNYDICQLDDQVDDVQFSVPESSQSNECIQASNYLDEAGQFAESYFSWLCYNGLFCSLAFLATLERSWPTFNRQIYMNLPTFLLQAYLIQAYHQNMLGPSATALDFHGVATLRNTATLLALKLSLIVPSLITNLLIVSDWICFLKLLAGQLAIGCLYYSLQLSLGYVPQHPGMANFTTFGFFMSLSLLVLLAFSAITFAIFEKISKERFVINQTNSQTRKLFGELINTGSASIMVKPDGKITFYNETFRSLIMDRLLFDSLPTNIFSMFDKDSDSSEQLRLMMIEVFNQDKGRKGADYLTRNVIELRIPRKIQPQVNKIDRSAENNINQIVEEESKDQSSRSMASGAASRADNISEASRLFAGQGQGQGSHQKTSDIRVFEMLRITCEVSQHSAAKECLILSMESIADYEGYAHLLVSHSLKLQDFLTRLVDLVQSKMIENTTNAKPADEINSSHNDTLPQVAESVSNPQAMLSAVGQIQYEVNLMSVLSVAQTLWNAHLIEHDFLLQKNISNIIESCSNLYQNHPDINFLHDDRLVVVNGDLEMLKLAIHTLVHFALKYCAKDDQITFRTVFDGMVQENEVYLVSFQLTIPMNPKYNHQKISELLNQCDPYGSDCGFDDINTFYLMRSISFGDYLEEFGMGILLLPSLIYILNCDINAKLQKDKKIKGRGSIKLAKSNSGESDLKGEEKQNYVVNLQVPLNLPEKSGADEITPPVIIPEEFSNRVVDENKTRWKSPALCRNKYSSSKSHFISRPCQFQIRKSLNAPSF